MISNGFEFAPGSTEANNKTDATAGVSAETATIVEMLLLPLSKKLFHYVQATREDYETRPITTLNIGELEQQQYLLNIRNLRK